jgi:hypothetical protein
MHERKLRSPTRLWRHLSTKQTSFLLISGFCALSQFGTTRKAWRRYRRVRHSDDWPDVGTCIVRTGGAHLSLKELDRSMREDKTCKTIRSRSIAARY